MNVFRTAYVYVKKACYTYLFVVYLIQESFVKINSNKISCVKKGGNSNVYR